MQRAGFVIGAGSSRATKRLLPDNCAGRFVIDIEIARGIAQRAFNNLI